MDAQKGQECGALVSHKIIIEIGQSKLGGDAADTRRNSEDNKKKKGGRTSNTYTQLPQSPLIS